MSTPIRGFSHRSATAAKRFLAERSGTAIVVFGLALIPAALAAGAAVDFGRAALFRAALQEAADAGVLAAGARSGATQADRAAIARNTVLTNLGTKADSAEIAVTETEPGAGVYQVQVTGKVSATIMRIAHYDSTAITVSSEARSIGGTAAHPIEIALALDNTGSMRDDMPALKQAARALVSSVMSDGAGGAVKMSVVPYVAAVNPGLTDMSHVDTRAQSPWAGNWFNYAWLAHDSHCTPVWGGGGGTSPGGSSSGDVSGDASDLLDILNPFRRIATQLFGVSTAQAAEVTPNTLPTLALQTLTSSVTGKSFQAPVGFTLHAKSASGGGCDWLLNPSLVSAYELFNRVRSVSGASAVAWKGCVEARATAEEVTAVNSSWGRNYTIADYDVNETAPSTSNPATLFTPYFWPDEPDYSTTTWSAVAPGKFVPGSGGFHNNYLPDHDFPTSWGWKRDDWNNGRGILKYDGQTPAALITETAPETYGPNAACPEALTRLTNDKARVVTAIDRMNFWYNGGTVISEGLMWAWRTLSPNAPFGDGLPYADANARKVIVLMTDGVNGLADNGNAATANISDYSAYGYLGASRLNWADGLTTYAGLQTFLDNRLKKACANAKAAGVTIYTVMFNHNGFLNATDQSRSTSLLQACASKPEYAFFANDSTALSAAFGQIAVSAAATPLRLSR